MPGPEDGQPSAVFVSIALTCLVVAAYASSCTSGMLWDDSVIVTDNLVLRLPDGLARIWRGETVVDYFPLTYSLVWLQYRFFGNHAAGYHVVNIAMHSVSVLLVYSVLRRLRVPVAALTAALFAVHPVVGTSVEWISEQKNTLSLAFYAASTLAFIRTLEMPSGERRAFFWWAVSLGMFLLALMGKPSGIFLPFVFALLARTRGRGWGDIAVTITPYLLLCLLMGVATLWFQKYHSISVEEIPIDPWSVRLAAAGWNVLFYARMLALPLRQSMVYPYTTPDPATLVAWLPDALLVGVAFGLWRARPRLGSLPLIGFVYALLMLAPVLGFVPMSFSRYSRVADHFVYLGAIGFLGLYAAAAHAITRSWAPRWVRSAVVGLVLGGLVWLDQGRCAALASRTTCWRDVIAKYPDVWVAYADLGSSLIAERDPASAIPVLETHVKLRPDDAGSHYNLGVALMALERYPEAEKAMRTATRVEPRRAAAHNDLGICLMQLRRPDDALREYRWAQRLDMSLSDAFNNEGALLLDLGHPAEAIRPLERACRLAPNDVKPLTLLTHAYLDSGRAADAIETARRLTTMRPEDAEGWVLLGIASLDSKHEPEAREALRRALSARTTKAIVLNDVGLLSARLGDRRTALTLYRKAQARDAAFPLAVNNEAWLLATAVEDDLRDAKGAREALRRAWTLSRADDPQVLDTAAAVAAESGDLAQATDIAHQAACIARERGMDALAREIERRRARYAEGHPWRE